MYLSLCVCKIIDGLFLLQRMVRFRLLIYQRSICAVPLLGYSSSLLIQCPHAILLRITFTT